MPKIRNIIIFVVIGAIIVLIYVFFINKPGTQNNLVSSPVVGTLPNGNAPLPSADTTNGTSLNTADFLTLLLSVKSITLNDSIFSDPAWGSLHDSSITLVPDATTGRPNPFAQLGNDVVATTPPAVTSSPTTTPKTPISAPAVNIPLKP
jgi:hypothetical protein